MNARYACWQALCDILDRGAYANLRLKTIPDTFSERDRRFLFALAYTTLDHLLYIDYLLMQYARRGAKPAVRNILRIGVCELLFFGTPAHAAISEAVTLSRLTGNAHASGFVNVVLRSVDRDRAHPPALPDDPIEQLSIRYSYPIWLVQEWYGQYGAGFTEQMLAVHPAQMEVRAQYPETVEALLSELAIPAEPGTLDQNAIRLSQGADITRLPAFIEGRMTVQSESAMLVCRALGDCRGKRVLDACAAPGGKAAYIASLCENDVHLTCMELHAHRKALLDSTLARLHVHADTLVHDATIPIPAFAGAFDAVLLDAPCSGLGLTSDKPDVRYSKTDADVNALANLQQKLLSVCAGYVREGGVLVYATCTISRRENEDNIAPFLAAQPGFKLDTLPLPLENNGMLQLFPHVHGTDGFFIARMIRCN